MKEFKINWILIIAIAVVIIIIVARSSSRAQSNQNITPNLGGSIGSGNQGNTGTPQLPPVSNTSGLPELGRDTVLSRGAYGFEVKLIQAAYNALYADKNGKPRLAEDGQFGPLTEAAIQESTGLTSISYSDFVFRISGVNPSPISGNDSSSESSSPGSNWYDPFISAFFI